MHVQNRSSFPSEKSETFKRIDNNPHLHRNLIFLHDTAKKNTILPPTIKCDKFYTFSVIRLLTFTYIINVILLLYYCYYFFHRAIVRINIK